MQSVLLKRATIWNSVIAIIQSNPPPSDTIQTQRAIPTNTQSYNVGFLINCYNNSWWSLTCVSGILCLNDFIFSDSPLNRSHLRNSIISLPIGNSVFLPPADCWLVCYWKTQHTFCYIFIETPLSTIINASILLTIPVKYKCDIFLYSFLLHFLITNSS